MAGMNGRTRARVFIGATVAWAGLAAAAQAQTPVTIGGVGAGSANLWPSYIAIAKSFYKEVGLTPEYVATQSSAAVMQQLAAGSLDMGTGGLVDPIRAIDKGAPITLFRTEDVVAPYELLARPSITRIADLKGKTVMIGGPKDITRLYMERMLAAAGLGPNDVDYVYAGATAPRLSALVAGSIDATLLSPPFNFQALSAGQVSLGATPDIARGMPYTGYAVSIPWARQHKAQLKDFLSAYTRGVDWFYDRSHRDEAVDIALKHLNSNRGDLEKTYDFFTRLKIYDRVGSFAGSGLETLLNALKTSRDLEGSTDVSRFVDASLAPP